MNGKPNELSHWRPHHNPWLIAISVMLATFMEILDTSVANVSLPHIAGNLSATTDESTWVLTSYLVANAIILPATGWLGNYFGRKCVLLTCITLFTAASMMAGAAPNLPFLIVSRAIQGLAGGALQPIAQAVLLESFPPRDRGVAMAVFGLGVVVAPTVGPTLGGWITDDYSWRWIFYINLPIGIFAVLMARAFVEDPPYIKEARGRGSIDYIGFGLLALWLGTLQIIMDKGQEDDWFGAVWIRWAALIVVIGFFAFIIRECCTNEPIVHLGILKNRNFGTGVLLIGITGAILYSTITLLPLYLQTLMGYTALESGLALSPRGLGAIAAMLIIGQITRIVDNRWLIMGGFILLGWSSFVFGEITLQIGIGSIIWPNVLNGVAVAFVFVPLTTMSMGTLPPQEVGNATGIYNLMRNIGGGIGISAVTTFLARHQQTEQALMSSHTTIFDPQFQERLHALQAALSAKMGAYAASHAAYKILYNELSDQARVWAFVQNFRWVAILSVLSAVAVLLFKKVHHPTGPVGAH